MAELLKKRPKERPLGEVKEAPVVLVPPMPAELFSQETAPRGVTGPGFALLEAAAAALSLSVRLYRARRSLLFAQILQSLLLGVVLLVIAYALYAPAFVGTGAQLAAIFLWAFAIDITVDAVITAARGTGSP
jgi:hypothetical protein